MKRKLGPKVRIRKLGPGRTYVDLGESLMDELKEIAEVNGESFSALLRRVLNDWRFAREQGKGSIPALLAEADFGRRMLGAICQGLASGALGDEALGIVERWLADLRAPQQREEFNQKVEEAGLDPAR